MELRVGLASDECQFVEVLVPAPRDLARRADDLTADLAVTVGDRVPLSLATDDWLARCARSLIRGEVWVIDYAEPIANLLGLHTSYELGRLAGRYRDIEQERSAQRTVYPLSPARPVDLFDLRQRYAFLSKVMDADYGSATFVPVRSGSSCRRERPTAIPN